MTDRAIYSTTPENVWRLEQPFRCMDGDTEMFVRADFEWDCASVPRIVWSIIAPMDLGAEPPLIHDWLYRSMGNPTHGSLTPPRTYTRPQADSLFLRHMKQRGVSWWRRYSAYAAVRTMGRGSWRLKPANADA